MGFFAQWMENRRLKREENIRRQAELKAKRQKQLQIWGTEDLNQYATKIDGVYLKRNEFCYLAINEVITWNEDRTRTKRINYSGPTASVHLMKGLNYRVGSVSVRSEKVTETIPVFSGKLLLTNKRVFLLGNNGLKAITLSSIVMTSAYTDGTALYRASGKRILLTGFSDAARFNIYLERILNDKLAGIPSDSSLASKDVTPAEDDDSPRQISVGESSEKENIERIPGGISDDDPRKKLIPLFKAAKDTAIERAKSLCDEDLKLPPDEDNPDLEFQVISRVLPIFHKADLFYKEGQWIQAEDLWLKILKDMPNHAGQKLAILYRKEKRYRDENDVINAAENYARTAISLYANVDRLLARKDTSHKLEVTKSAEDNSILVSF